VKSLCWPRARERRGPWHRKDETPSYAPQRIDLDPDTMETTVGRSYLMRESFFGVRRYSELARNLGCSRRSSATACAASLAPA
jgi:hypothetical protein